jgi:hypothetical protein
MVSEQQELRETGQPEGQASTDAAVDGSQGRMATLNCKELVFQALPFPKKDQQNRSFSPTNGKFYPIKSTGKKNGLLRKEPC